MNFLLTSSFKYKYQGTIDETKKEMKARFSTPWYDILPNMKGGFYDADHFRLAPKLSMGISILAPRDHLAIITGQLFERADYTSIHINVRPPYIVIINFYLLLLVFLIVSAGLFHSITDQKVFCSVFLLVALTSSIAFINSSKVRMRKRFERIMHLR